jgi:hypothetical protein
MVISGSFLLALRLGLPAAAMAASRELGSRHGARAPSLDQRMVPVRLLAVGRHLNSSPTHEGGHGWRGHAPVRVGPSRIGAAPSTHLAFTARSRSRRGRAPAPGIRRQHPRRSRALRRARARSGPRRPRIRSGRRARPGPEDPELASDDELIHTLPSAPAGGGSALPRLRSASFDRERLTATPPLVGGRPGPARVARSSPTQRQEHAYRNHARRRLRRRRSTGVFLASRSGFADRRRWPHEYALARCLRRVPRRRAPGRSPAVRRARARGGPGRRRARRGPGARRGRDGPALRIPRRLTAALRPTAPGGTLATGAARQRARPGGPSGSIRALSTSIPRSSHAVFTARSPTSHR